MAAFAASVLIFYPGFLSFDSAYQFWQARTGHFSNQSPVVMTALMAAIGLLPAALSTGIGSESQKPLATVVIGGLITSTILTLLILPIIYTMSYNLIHRRENRKLLRKIGAVSK